MLTSLQMSDSLTLRYLFKAYRSSITDSTANDHPLYTLALPFHHDELKHRQKANESHVMYYPIGPCKTNSIKHVTTCFI